MQQHNVTEKDNVVINASHQDISKLEEVTPALSQRFIKGDCLARTVDQYLARYFKNLGGMTPPPELYEKVMEQVEKPLIEHVLRYVHGNQLRASAVLGINRNTLRKKMTTLNIDVHKIKQHH
jgi:two-component system nitrogen regulation response regulator GlnG